MPRVVALYRYPLKGFTPEKCDTLTVLPKGESPVTGFSGFASPIRKHPNDAWSSGEQSCQA
jgi:uncharacterized protein